MEAVVTWRLEKKDSAFEDFELKGCWAFEYKIPVGKEEEHGWAGKYTAKRRPSRKNLHDINYLMNYDAKEVERSDAMETDIILESVDWMFGVVSGAYLVK
jgi:hypothetical protein